MVADRAQLLAAAQRAIESIGPEVTMDQIAAEARVTKPILYRTIGDKDALIDALSDVLVDRIVHVIATSFDPTARPRSVFTSSVRAYLSAVDADRDLYLFVNATGQRKGPLRRRINRSAQPIIDMFASGNGHPGPTTSSVTWSHSIIGALQTVTLMWMADDHVENGVPNRSIDDITDDLARLLWPGVEEILAANRSGAAV